MIGSTRRGGADRAPQKKTPHPEKKRGEGSTLVPTEKFIEISELSHSRTELKQFSGFPKTEIN